MITEVPIGLLRYSVDGNEPITLVELLQCNAESLTPDDVVDLLELLIGQSFIGGLWADVERLPNADE